MIDFAKLVLAADTSQLKAAVGDINAVGAAGAATEAKTNRAAAAMALAFKGAAIAAGALALAGGLAFRQYLRATIETEKVQAQLAAAIASTGGAAGRTIDQLNESAMALQRLTVFGDEATNAMQGLLLTFTNIKGEQFDQATTAVMDMATAMGSDLQSAALQVGKALNDPLLGISALGRAGVQFSEEQKETIKTLVELGDVAGAQTIILAELERQFGGSARAARETLGGALTALGNAWGDLFEVSGPGAENLRQSIEGLVDVISDPNFVKSIQDLGSGIFDAFSVAIKAVAGLQMAYSDLRDALGFRSAQYEVAQALQTASEAMSLQIRASGALATSGLGPGARVSRDYAQAQLQIVEATLAATEAQRTQLRESVRMSDAYQNASRDVQNATESLMNLTNAQREAGDAIDPSQFGSLNPYKPFVAEIELATQELTAALDIQLELMRAVNDTSPEYQALVIEAERLRASLANSTGEFVTLKDAATEGGLKVQALAAAGSTLPGVFGAAAASASGLAGQIGVAEMAAARLIGQLRQAPAALASLGAQVDGIMSNLARQNSELSYMVEQGLGQSAAAIKTARDSAIALALANGASIDSVAELGATFDQQAAEAERLAAANSGLTETLHSVSDAAGGGTTGGTGGATASVEDLRGAYDSLMASMDPALAAQRSMAAGIKVADDALAAGAITAEEYADAIKRIEEEYAQSGGGDGKNPMVSSIEAFGDAFADFVESGGQDFESFTKSMVQNFSSAVKQMVAEWAAAQLTKSFAQTGAAIGGAIGAVAGAVVGWGLGKLFNSDGTPKADAREKQRLQIEMEILRVQGKTHKIRQMELEMIDGQNRDEAMRLIKLEDQKKAEEERFSLQQQIWQLTGQTQKLRSYELSLLDKDSRALQRRIWAIEDRQNGGGGPSGPANPNKDSLQLQIWELTGKTGLIRRAELEGLTKVERRMQKRIWQLEDEEEALAEAAAKAEEIASDRKSLEREWYELIGDTKKLRELDLAEMDKSLHPLQLRIWALQDEREAATAAAEAADRLANSLSTSQFASLFEYERAVGLARYGNMPAVGPESTVSSAIAAGTSGTASAETVSNTDALLTILVGKITTMTTILRDWQGGGMPPTRPRGASGGIFF